MSRVIERSRGRKRGSPDSRSEDVRRLSPSQQTTPRQSGGTERSTETGQEEAMGPGFMSPGVSAPSEGSARRSPPPLVRSRARVASSAETDESEGVRMASLFLQVFDVTPSSGQLQLVAECPVGNSPSATAFLVPSSVAFSPGEQYVLTVFLGPRGEFSASHTMSLFRLNLGPFSSRYYKTSANPVVPAASTWEAGTPASQRGFSGTGDSGLGSPSFLSPRLASTGFYANLRRLPCMSPSRFMADSPALNPFRTRAGVVQHGGPRRPASEELPEQQRSAVISQAPPSQAGNTQPMSPHVRSGRDSATQSDTSPIVVQIRRRRNTSGLEQAPTDTSPPQVDTEALPFPSPSLSFRRGRRVSDRQELTTPSSSQEVETLPTPPLLGTPRNRTNILDEAPRDTETKRPGTEFIRNEGPTIAPVRLRWSCDVPVNSGIFCYGSRLRVVLCTNRGQIVWASIRALVERNVRLRPVDGMFRVRRTDDGSDYFYMETNNGAFDCKTF